MISPLDRGGTPGHLSRKDLINGKWCIITRTSVIRHRYSLPVRSNGPTVYVVLPFLVFKNIRNFHITDLLKNATIPEVETSLRWFYVWYIDSILIESQNR